MSLFIKNNFVSTGLIADVSRSVQRDAVLLFAAVTAGLLATPILNIVFRAGVNMVPHDLATDYVVGAVWAALLGVGILLWPVPFVDRCVLLALWVVKVGVALGFMLFYEKNYSSLDAYGYFFGSIQPAFDWSQVRFGNGTGNLMALTWLHGRILPNSYHALKITFAMVGLIAIYVFYRSALIAGARSGLRLLVLLALVPSMLFWSSIVGKDPIILLGVAVYTYAVVKWVIGPTVAWLPIALVGIAIASLIRIWLAPIMTLPLIVAAIRRDGSPMQKTVAFAIGIAAFVFAASLFRQQFLQGSTTDLVEAANTYSQGWAQGGSGQTLATPFSGIPSLIKFIPIGVFTALLRPLPGEVRNLFGWLAGIENLAFFLLAVVAIWRTRPADFKNPLVVWAISLVASWAILYGFISYQNLGTGVRFRLQILPIFLLLLLYLARSRTERNVGLARFTTRRPATQW